MKIYFEDYLNKKLVIIYMGRFYPPGPHHIRIIKNIQNLFKGNKLFILTADPKEINEKTPFSFKQKKQIFKIQGINPSIVKKLTGSGFNIENIKNIIKQENYNLLFIIGKKDIETGEKNRILNSDFFVKYSFNKPTKLKSNQAYIYIIDNDIKGKTVSNSSNIRKLIKNKNESSLIKIYSEKLWNEIKRVINFKGKSE